MGDKTLLTFDILEYYDSQIKEWVTDKIKDNTNSSIVFSDKDSLPSTGKINTLYVTKDGLFIWDNDYIAISSTGGESEKLEWGSF